MKKMQKYFTLDDTGTVVTYLGEFPSWEEANDSIGGDRLWLHNQDTLAKMIASAFEAFNIGMTAEPPKPDTDTYFIRITIPTMSRTKDTIQKEIQELYDTGNIAGSFDVVSDNSLTHISFGRSLAEDDGYMNVNISQGIIPKLAAAIQLRHEFKHMSSAYQGVQMRSHIMEALTEYDRIDVRFPVGSKYSEK